MCRARLFRAVTVMILAVAMLTACRKKSEVNVEPQEAEITAESVFVLKPGETREVCAGSPQEQFEWFSTDSATADVTAETGNTAKAVITAKKEGVVIITASGGGERRHYKTVILSETDEEPQNAINTTKSFNNIAVFQKKGTASVMRDHNTMDVVENMKLKTADYSTVGRDSMLRLSLDDDMYAYFEENSEFAVSKGWFNKIKVALTAGEMIVEVRSSLSGDDSFDIMTPNSNMAIRGTVVGVKCEILEDGTCRTVNYVLEGTAELTLSDGTHRTLRAGEGQKTVSDAAGTIIDSSDAGQQDLDLKDIDVSSLKGAGSSGETEKTAEYIADGRLKALDISDYPRYGNGYGGVVPVNNGEYWGAVNYDGEVIVPFEYNWFASPDNSGHFILGLGGDSYYNSEKYLFDRNGTVITSTTEDIVASSEGYIKTFTDVDDFDFTTRYEYYRYDESLILISELGGVDGAHGFYDGKSIIAGNVKDPVYYREDYNKGLTPYEFGIVNTDGSIKWIEGDGVNESDMSLFLSQEEYENKMQEEAMAHPYGGAGAGGGIAEIDVPSNPANHGYFWTQTGGHEVEGLYLRDLDGRTVAWVYPWDMTITGDVLNYTAVETSRFGRLERSIMYSGTDYPETESTFRGYYYDGDYYYNYGPVSVLKADDKYALINLENGDLQYRVFDYCAMSESPNWLISKDGQWGYCDHKGNILCLYEDATDFSNGYALVKENGIAYMIDESFGKVAEAGPADSLVVSGEIFGIEKDGEWKYYVLSDNQ